MCGFRVAVALSVCPPHTRTVSADGFCDDADGRNQHFRPVGLSADHERTSSRVP